MVPNIKNWTQLQPQCNHSMSELAAFRGEHSLLLKWASYRPEDLSQPLVSSPHCLISLCSDSRQLCLVDGGGRCSGRVEILDQGSSGTICDDGWDLDDARVVCRQLSCREALDATLFSSFGTGSGPIWLDEVNCRGEESQVWRCPTLGWLQHNCDHQEDAGVVCSGMVSSLSTG